MRRAFVILMLVLLPFQFSWAAVAAYCAHEAAAAGADHVGHHDHQHAAAPAVPAGDYDTSASFVAADVDLDCGQCHGHASVMPAAVHGIAAPLRGPLLFTEAPVSRSAHPSARPERPQWQPLA